jgi:hypothetical protein
VKSIAFKVWAFLLPLFKTVSVQPTINDKPCGKPFRWTIIKLGFWVIAIDRCKFKVQVWGKVTFDECQG